MAQKKAYFDLVNQQQFVTMDEHEEDVAHTEGDQDLPAYETIDLDREVGSSHVNQGPTTVSML